MFGKRHNHPIRWSAAASILAFPALLACVGATRPAPARRSGKDLDKQFSAAVRPFLRTYCVSCHGRQSPQAQLDLAADTNVDSVARDYPRWSRVIDKLSANQMPPPGARPKPSPGECEAVIAWIKAVRKEEAGRNAGDPGPVFARRLSNAEYDYTIRDLTGVDLRPTREFPVDPANQEGFDNSGESLTFSPVLMKKYLDAVKGIADHMVLTSSGLEFATHPVLVETDRDKYCILRIVDFYKRQPTDLADYFLAAWRYRNRAALGEPNATLQTVAARARVSPKYLDLIWKTLTDSGEKVGPIARLQSLWNALPSPDKGHPDAAREGCVAMRDWVVALRRKVACRFDNLRVPRGFSDGGQCFVLWKDRQYASHRRQLNAATLQIGGVPPPKVVRPRRSGRRITPEQTVPGTVDPELSVPQDEAARAPYLAAFSRFCSVFPDAFYIAERGRMFVDDPGDQGRLLTAGLHNSMGYFRDDSPLMELILDEKGRRELDRLWLDFDMVAFVPERMHLEFFVYERAEAGTITDPEFNFARAEDKSALSDEKIRLLGDLYLAKARRNGAEPGAIEAIEEHFKRVSVNIRAAERARLAAEPAHLRALVDLARRAYRRPLAETERTGIPAFYQSLRQKEGLSHEEAIRDTLISILMSPKFLFRLDLDDSSAAAATITQAAPVNRVATFMALSARHSAKAVRRAQPSSGDIQPLSDYALASRLSYFLWSSMPDETLLAHAAAGDLHRPEVLAAQARRMLRDWRVRDLAVEFGGNWLDIRRFEEHNAVDRERFASFTDELREAMYEEPVRFMTDLFSQDRSALDLLYGKYTFVNAVLARHYGMNDVKAGPNDWMRVDGADRYGRGGLLPMGAFLTKNAPGLRTSPVKRGYWVVRRLLGETIPPPPPTVPQLPSDESKMGEVTLRQALAQHRSNPACAGCHARFDSYGLVFEGYGPIGELRSKDLGGKPIDARAPFPGGIERSGVTGLQEFIRSRRQSDFLDNFDRKLLSYALGRSLQPSDDQTLAEMRQRSAAAGYRVGPMVETIVMSRQFRNRRAAMPLKG